MIKNYFLALCLSVSALAQAQNTYSPAEFSAKEKEINNAIVELQWYAPNDTGWVQNAQGGYNSGYGFDESKIFQIATHWNKENLKRWHGMSIDQVGFLFNSDKVKVEVRIWEGDDKPTTIIHQQNINGDIVAGTWANHSLETPLVIDSLKSYWIGYEIDAKAGSPIGCVTGSLKTNTNYINHQGSWQVIDEIYPYFERNFAVRIHLSNSNSDLVPSGYNLYRNNIKINSEIITSTNYKDSLTEEGKFTYAIEAVYGEKTSVKEKISPIEFNPNVLQRNYMVVEKKTGTNCGYCPYAAKTLAEMHNNAKKVAVLAYHEFGGDPFQTPEISERLRFYTDFGGAPSMAFDGLNTMAGAMVNISDYYNKVNGYYRERMEKYTNVSMEAIQGKHKDGNFAIIKLKNIASEDIPNLKLHGVITESTIDFAWMTEKELHDVVRKMLPNAKGTPIKLNANGQAVAELPYAFGEDWNSEKCELTFFVQDTVTREIHQAIVVHPKAEQFLAYNIKLNIIEESPTYNFTWKYDGASTDKFTVKLNGEIVKETTETTFDLDTTSLENNKEYLLEVSINNSEDFVTPFVFKYSTITANNDILSSEKPIIYPNPANNKIFIQTDKNISNVCLFSAQGKLVKEFKNNKGLDVSDLTNGIYILLVKTEDNSYTQKISINH